MNTLINLTQLISDTHIIQIKTQLSNSSSTLLLSQDGVYNIPSLDELSVPFLILQDDAQLRGISIDDLESQQVIDYSQFVELTLTHQAVQKC
ncbi:DsrH/TusB family sulfur metabolism protein [Algibacillus agarilyticus]|uniref:DsrH/TusB family sulfur metabolism protein n=1 Tax=Algibacillus agarilyticus TaxID=2234133 RepID=UPI000DCF904D|nr:DsrH/TusB family sulfur metabolism protein [Algibacillus agarilyticus]